MASYSFQALPESNFDDIELEIKTVIEPGEVDEIKLIEEVEIEPERVEDIKNSVSEENGMNALAIVNDKIDTIFNQKSKFLDNCVDFSGLQMETNSPIKKYRHFKQLWKNLERNSIYISHDKLVISKNSLELSDFSFHDELSPVKDKNRKAKKMEAILNEPNRPSAKIEFHIELSNSSYSEDMEGIMIETSSHCEEIDFLKSRITTIQTDVQSRQTRNLVISNIS